jgi:hypothetical protein
MPIETNFAYRHKFARNTAKASDLLGPLRGLVGRTTKRSWRGRGFNLIWRPNFAGQSGPKHYFLQLTLTDETLDFTDITGTGIANRALLQKDIALGGLGYLQQVSDRFDGSHQHFEPGVWLNVPATVNPTEEATIVRMGSIPHGTTINLQGTAAGASWPQITAQSITPFKLGSPDDGKTDLVRLPEEDLAQPSASRTPMERLRGLTQVGLANPSLFLSEAISRQQVLGSMVLSIASDAGASCSAPDAGGGTDNIAFLAGKGAPPAGGPNARVLSVTATYWIERIRDQDGREFDQLQYTQRVLLHFAGLSWPHVTVATLR